MSLPDDTKRPQAPEQTDDRTSSSGAGATSAGASERPVADAHATPPGAVGARGRDVAVDADEDEDEWRHEPIAPVDERNPLKSLGKAVADTVTGGSETASKPGDR